MENKLWKLFNRRVWKMGIQKNILILFLWIIKCQLWMALNLLNKLEIF